MLPGTLYTRCSSPMLLCCASMSVHTDTLQDFAMMCCHAVLWCLAGHFKCSKCPSKGMAITQYLFMLLGVLVLNMYLISQLSRATMTDFTTVSGSDYLSVSHSGLINQLAHSQNTVHSTLHAVRSQAESIMSDM